jgi:hypothetical protein
MKFSVPTNWQEDLLDIYAHPLVLEVYGKLAEDFIGGGRPAYSLSGIFRRRAARYVKNIHKGNSEFNYLLNSSCMAGREFTRSGKKKIFRLLDWLVSIGTDSVTVSLPYLAELIKNNYPVLKIKVSVMAHVDSLEKAKFWESQGAESITLLHTKINRDFKLLKQIRNNIKCKLQLIANNHCLYGCHLEDSHELFASHSSQTGYYGGNFSLDYCYLTCRYQKLKKPELLISSPWIRPEDVRFYEEIGIDSIKVVDRRMPSPELIKIINAYITGKYEGNLIDLFPNLGGFSFVNLSNILLKLKYFLYPFQTNIFLLKKMKKLLEKLEIFIDNRSLDGFLDFFLTHDCGDIACDECGYCRNVAVRVVRIDRQYQNRLCQEYGKFLDSFLINRFNKGGR